MKKVFFFASLLCLLAGCSELTVDNSVMDGFRLERFLGRWYEIARFDHYFERGMENTMATYYLRTDATVEVLNTGMKDGEPAEAKGMAKMTETPGLLRVSFFGPFYSDYRIMMVDSAYQYALIGGGSDDYLWILSRTPKLDDDTKDLILNEATRRGYDIGKLIWVKHE